MRFYPLELAECRRAREEKELPTRVFGYRATGPAASCGFLAVLLTTGSVLEATAQGFGSATPGGDGQPVVVVTNRNDAGPGSFRDAVSRGGRTVRFDVGGTIELAGEVSIRGSFVTVDGSSAPSPGITLRGAGLRIDGPLSDVVVRGIRVRDPVLDGITIKNGAHRILVENVSVDGCGDGSIDVTQGAHDVTIAWSVLSRCAKNLLITSEAERVTLHHNVFVRSQFRNAQIVHSNDGALARDTTADMRNNLVWDWGNSGGGTGVGCGAKANIVANFYSSPQTSAPRQARAIMVDDCADGGGRSLAHTSGNVSGDRLPFDLNTLGNQAPPFAAAFVDTTDACTGARDALARAGASPLDDVDRSLLGAIDLSRCRSESIGLFGPTSSVFSLLLGVSAPQEMRFQYGPPSAGWVPLSGDWNGDGVDTVGLYVPEAGVFLLRNSNSAGPAELAFQYGPPSAGWVPLSGDWNGDGVDTVGLYVPEAGIFLLRSSNSAGPAELAFQYGPPSAGWVPLVGDWNGDGVDTVGLYDPQAGVFLLRSSNSPGPADLAFEFGPRSSVWTPLSGDWDGDGVDTVGLHDPEMGVFRLRTSHAAGSPDTSLSFASGDGTTPLSGLWTLP